jgi:LacI family transcriptional regulator
MFFILPVMDKRPVTIADVAAEAGVSTFTVSLALRDNPRVKAETRRQVQAVAARLGYQRNAAFAVLGARSRIGRRAVSGLTLAAVSQCGKRDGGPLVLQRLISGLPIYATRLGYRIEEHSLEETVSARQLARQLYARGVAGVIFSRTICARTLLDADWSPFALVSLCARLDPLPVHTVRNDLFVSSYESVSRMRHLGFRRIGCLARHHEPLRLLDDHARFGGMMAALNEDGEKIPPLVVAGFSNTAGLEEWAAKWRPDVIIGTFEADRVAVRALPAPPVYASLVEHRHPPESGYTYCYFNPMTLGRISVEWIDQMLRLGEFGFPSVPRTQLVRGVWIDAGTAAQPQEML